MTTGTQQSLDKATLSHFQKQTMNQSGLRMSV